MKLGQRKLTLATININT